MTKPKPSIVLFIGWALMQILPDRLTVKLMFWMQRHRKYFVRAS